MHEVFQQYLVLLKQDKKKKEQMDRKRTWKHAASPAICWDRGSKHVVAPDSFVLFFACVR